MTLSVNSKRVIFIPKGSTNYIITYLDKKNYSLNFIDKAVVNYFGYPQSGWIDLKAKTMSKLDFLYKITHSKAAIRSVTLIPGETYYYFLNQISDKLNIPSELLFKSYFKYAYKLDGNIVPQTYSLPLGMKADEIIKYLIDYSNKEYKKYSLKIFGTYNKKNWYSYISMASVIQKESASKEEMPTVSSVIYNRLKKKMKLQMDGTLNYGPYSHTKITSTRIKTDQSDYNTYKVVGLPSDPVCAVSFDAIKSAIFPIKSDYLYFMKSVDGTKHVFSNNYASHKKVINKVKKSARYKKQLQKLKDKKKVKKSYKKLQNNNKEKKETHFNSLWKNVM